MKRCGRVILTICAKDIDDRFKIEETSWPEDLALFLTKKELTDLYLQIKKALDDES